MDSRQAIKELQQGGRPLGLAQLAASQQPSNKPMNGIDGKTPIANTVTNTSIGVGRNTDMGDSANTTLQQGRPQQQGSGGLLPATNGLAGMYSNIPNLYTTPNSNYTIMNGTYLI